jgi:tetratricopeptide (TPR) repeat protein
LENKSTIFLSYSRKDSEVANWLKNQLFVRDFIVFQDLYDTIVGEEWWQRLKELILQADQIIFLMSSNSVKSKVCADEIKYAKSLNKRIFPVLIQDIDWRSVPEGISKIQSVFLHDSVDKSFALRSLTEALSLDLKWVREHTRLLNRAHRWKLKNEIEDELLFGNALVEAEKWLVSGPTSNVYPTTLHQEYINESRKTETAKQEANLKRVEEQNLKLKKEKGKVENNFRAGLDVISDLQYHIIKNLKNIRGISTTTQEHIINVMIAASERLKNNDPDFYPSSVQMQLSQNDLTAKYSLIEIYVKQGKFEKAKEISKEALKLAREFHLDDYNPLKRRPGLRQIASILADISTIYFEQRDIENALKYLLESKDLQKRCIVYYSEFAFVEDFREDLIDSLHRECVCYLHSGKKAKSLEVANEARKELDFLIENSGGKRDYTMMSNIVDFLIGDSLAENGRLTEAKELFHKILSAFEKRLETNTDNLNILHKKSLCLERLGNIEVLNNQTRTALITFEQTLMIKQLLIDADPSNIQFKKDFSIISNKIQSLKANNKE